MLTVEDVAVHFETKAALDGIDLTVGGREVVAVLGPSGCGKTTLLRVIAGLQDPERGRVRWDGRNQAGVPSHLRRFGLMFQDLALFPHKSVGGNVAFGLRIAGLEERDIEARVAEVLELVGLEGQEHRRIGTLSGGEQQRVALARALAPSPQLLMLDEPLGALDRALRERLTLELRRIFDEVGLPVLYVTHDQEEAFAVADRIAVMNRGRIEAEGASDELWDDPGTEFVARFLGFNNIVDAELGDGRAITPWGELTVGDDLPPGHHRLVVRPDAVLLDDTAPLRASVDSITFRGDHVLLRLRPVTGPPLEAVAARRPESSHVRWRVDPSGVRVVD